ncbi:MAG TPA: methyltransferase domain-containing protein [Rudaea sp.]|nr:methyltransferase domain-containing protein [Rudaea sp.]
MLTRGAAFHEGLAEGWSNAHAAGSFRARLDLFRTLLARSQPSGKHWLDLGCGSGVLTRELLAAGAHVVAVDGSPAMLAAAQAIAPAEQPVEWQLGDAQRLSSLADGIFDGVLCSSVVEYVDAPDAVLGEATRVLKPGGKLILSVPPTWSTVRMLQKAVRAAARLIGRAPFPYLAVSRFEVKPARLRSWFESAGFVVDGVTAFDPVLPRFALTLLRPALLVVEAHKT